MRPGTSEAAAAKALVSQPFDLDTDVAEQHDVSGTHPEVMARLDATRKRDGASNAPILELK